MNPFIVICIVLSAATLVALLMQRLRQPLIVGHVISGIILGPLILNIVQDTDTIHLFSRLGITILLFMVGLGLSPTVIREVGKASLIVGLVQVIVTSALGALLASVFGFSLFASIWLGIAFALSSTIIVAKVLQDKRDLGKLYSKIAIGMLVIQDLIAVVAISSFAAARHHLALDQATLLAILTALLAILIVFFVSLFILPVLTPLFASSQEFLFLFAIGWVLGLAAISQYIGFTSDIGALVAGMALAASPYHFEIGSRMKMLRDFFLVVFFVLLGAQLSFTGIQAIWLPAVAFSLFILIVNPLIVMTVMGLLGYNKKTGFLTGLTVAQISEFSILLILIAMNAGQIDKNALTLVTLVGLVTITADAYLMRHAEKIYARLSPWLSIFERKVAMGDVSINEPFEAVMFGYHRVGEDFLTAIKKQTKNYLVVDFDPHTIRKMEERHVPCRYGDAADDEFLDELRLHLSKLVVSTVPDFESNESLVSKIRKRNKKTVIILIAQTVHEAVALYKAGATYVILPHYLGGNYASLLLNKFGANSRKFAKERSRHLEHLRAKLA